MKEFTTCKESINACLSNKQFAIAHMYNEEKTMNMHIHNCYEIYYSISGGKQFLIDDKAYCIEKGDIFLINNYESHHLSQVDEKYHERIVFSVFPSYLENISSTETDLTECFVGHGNSFIHRRHLDKENQTRFIYLVHKIVSSTGFGAKLIETAAFIELMVLINSLYREDDSEDVLIGKYQHNAIVEDIMEYINQNIYERITISIIAKKFFLSESYICRLFKSETGTTINKYLTARRISIAKSKLSQGVGVLEACEQSGFNDYTNFVQIFTKTVGITPKKYSKGSAN